VRFLLRRFECSATACHLLSDRLMRLLQARRWSLSGCAYLMVNAVSSIRHALIVNNIMISITRFQSGG
jgi:hypothetical protein